MFSGLREYWSRLEDGRPGERFRGLYRYRRERRKDGQGRSRAIVTGLGILLILIGAGFGWLPGPGGFLAFLGVALVAAESRSAARALDWTELRLRSLVRRGLDVWQEGGLPERLLLSAAGLVIVGGTILAVGTLLARLQ